MSLNDTKDLPLFNYPGTPGFKENSTSKDAARAMRNKAGTLRARILDALKEFGPMTPDQVAGKMGETAFSIRPRFSELLAMDLIVDTGMRVKNESGCPAKVWRLAK